MTKSIIFAITALMTFFILGTSNALAADHTDGTISQDQPKAIPDWLRQSFLWYGEGKTSQDDLLNSMNWMMNQNLLHLSDEAAQEVEGLRDENRMLKEKIGVDPEGPGIVVRPVPGALPELPGFPEGCLEIYDPVCGRDGRTYPNECEANEAGVGIVHDGQCRDGPQRECPRGYTWVACAGICVPIGDENVCPDDHKWSEHSGQCTPDSDQCLCTQQYDPVCGTDGKTYGNKCEAGCADAEIKHDGQCSAECNIQCFKYDPVCGEDGNTYSCGQADAACHGVEVAHEGECQDDQCICTKEYVPVCGTDGKTYGNKCEAGCSDAEIEYEGQCTDEQVCRSNADCSGDDVCRDGACQIACNVQCIQYDPVCGEDGNTYSCGQADAACHGVEVAHEGECVAIRAMPAQ